MKKAKIVVVGSYNADISAQTRRFPRDGETVFGEALRFGSGGKGFNQAIAAARTGGEVITVAAVGDDDLGQRAFRQLKEEGMIDRYLLRKAQCATGSAVIEVSAESGENRIIAFRGANDLLSREDVAVCEKEIASADLLLTQLETHLDAVEAALELAAKHKIPTVLNPAPFREIPDKFFALTDYFTPNETEASFYSGVEVNTPEDAEKAAKILLAKGIRNVIITLGQKGALLCNGSQTLLQPAIPAKAVDTTGAGDSFNGGFCVALAEGKSVGEAMKFAACVASLAVTRPGAAEAMPHRDEVDRLYSSR